MKHSKDHFRHLNIMSYNSKKVFIGNLPFTVTKNELEKMFSPVSFAHYCRILINVLLTL